MMTLASQKSFIEYFLDRHFAVQARELTQSQSILQNQVENLSDHLFEKGAMVILVRLVITYFTIQLNLTSFTDSNTWCNLNDF